VQDPIQRVAQYYSLIIAIILLSYANACIAQVYPKHFKKISNGKGGLPVNMINPGASFGIVSAAIGDLDDDGVVDLAVGATNANGRWTGALYILFMKKDGSVKSTATVLNREFGTVEEAFASSVCPLGDLDDDGVEDIGVGAGYDREGAYHGGAFWILFMNKDGSVKRRQKINGTNGNFNAELFEENVFGTGAATIGDLDGDKNVEIAVGARTPGAVFVLFLNNNGTVKKWKKFDTKQLPVDPEGLVGYGVAGLGDINKDGIPDIAIGGHRSDLSFEDSGVVYIVFLTAAGDIKSFTQISSGSTNFSDKAWLFGLCMAGIGDYDKDGVPDMIVSGNDIDRKGDGGGAIWYIMLNANGTVKSTHKVSATKHPELQLEDRDFFGASISVLGDLIAVGAMHDDDGGTDCGAIWLLSK
jgi:hypothetical protein